MKDYKIAVVVPTIRKEQYNNFLSVWEPLFNKHNVALISVFDGKTVNLVSDNYGYSVGDIMGKDTDLIYNLNDGVRNLGFAYVAKFLPSVEYILTLDDDTEPFNDTIQDHLTALNQKVPVSWMMTASEFTRGFPYSIRDEAEVVLSHGVWEGVADWDAPTQLIKGNKKVTFYKGVIPKGVLYPMCAMNLAFKRKLLPFIYQAPMFDKFNRFADIWSGIASKREIDKRGWAVVTGFAKVYHKRASNVFNNLIKEAKGLKMNEEWWRKGDVVNSYFQLYKEKRERWYKFIKKYE